MFADLQELGKMLSSEEFETFKENVFRVLSRNQREVTLLLYSWGEGGLEIFSTTEFKRSFEHVSQAFGITTERTRTIYARTQKKLSKLKII